MSRTLAFLAPLLLAAGVAGAEVPAMTATVASGDILTGDTGMTLYTFDNDTDGVSNCYNQCAVNWPPLLAEAGAMADDDYTLVTRTDGTMQWAYYGHPLYYWKNDVAPGDVSGDGINGVWHVATPAE